ncbi:MAG: hypothetical protein ACREJP_06555 [Candidatus Methylomirabilales bacterium]
MTLVIDASVALYACAREKGFELGNRKRSYQLEEEGLAPGSGSGVDVVSAGRRLIVRPSV